MLHHLPADVVLIVLSHTHSAREIARVGLTSAHLYDLIFADPDHRIWRAAATQRLRALKLIPQEGGRAMPRWLPIVVAAKGWIWLRRGLEPMPIPRPQVAIGFAPERDWSLAGHNTIIEEATPGGRFVLALGFIPQGGTVMSWYVGGWHRAQPNGSGCGGDEHFTYTGHWLRGELEGAFTMSSCSCPDGLHPSAAAENEYGVVATMTKSQRAKVGKVVLSYCGGDRLEYDNDEKGNTIKGSHRFFGGRRSPELVISGVEWASTHKKGYIWHYPDPITAPAEFCRYRRHLLQHLHAMARPELVDKTTKIMKRASRLLPAGHISRYS